MVLLAHQVPLGYGEALLVAAGLVIWAAFGLTYHRGWERTGEARRGSLVGFVIGSSLVIAVVSPPLEHLAEDLVSVHMVQHVVLILVGAPLIVLSRPIETLLRGLPRSGRKHVGALRRTVGLTPATTGRVGRPVVVWLMYGVAIWFWHGAGPYELAADNIWVHLLEHAVFLTVALAFWSLVLAPGRSKVSRGFRILMVFTTAFHSVLLGALLTFADSVWYPSYVDSTVGYGLDPLADQQLAGLLMWIPGGLVYTGSALWVLVTMLSSQDDSNADNSRARERTGPSLT